ncbi:preprotein translocase subunit SecD [Halobacterium litoreum]|uniref:Protein-export membrane protein SecD n=1 Tax=Halobacterium litoreum TaxID=2039234 RepID=A0ABD5NEI0_9EURY|nr:preprotein translocase subunit SecD [Halobacterium litoreum]UHH13689.1 preprotein translocase subunit SecD [Halobacterium litoreum]
MSWFRENWRVGFLVVLLLASSVALFAPGIGASAGDSGGGNEASSPTNLQYGLELSGGVRLRASVVGVTAEGVDVTQANEDAIEANVSSALGLERDSVRAREGTDVVEVYSNASTSEVEAALTDLGYEPDNVRTGVTETTRDTIVTTIESKVDATGFSGTSVYTANPRGTSDRYVVIEVPGRNASQVKDLIEGRGEVEMWAYYPENGSQTNTTVITKQDLDTISQAQTDSRGVPIVPVELTDEGAEQFAADMRQYGFTQEGVGNCQWPNGGYCLLTTVDGEVVYDSSLGDGLARDMENGDFARSGTFVIEASTMEEARELQVNLRAGALPAELSFENSYYVSPSFAERYKPLSLVTGIAAALAVSLVVFLRYGDAKVAVPMVFTALSEVVILLGFAAVSGLALDLSHIAGFIAVIGTGVDDLVIIADEVMTEEVSSSRVFQSRFRKALWTIGAAAATTIIAMSPLAVLSLSDLWGFAVVTILGVLVGVLITRPAYGDILRRLLTQDH